MIHARFHPAQRGGGFTLIELLVSSAILSLVLLAASSSIMVVTRAIPDGRGRSNAMILANRAVDTIANDLSFATAVSRASASEVEFSIPDRSGDGEALADVVCYAWSGTAGQPLTKRINGTTVNLIDKVNLVQFQYDKRLSPTTPNQYLLKTVTCRVQVFNDATTSAWTTIRIYNDPVVTGP